MAARKSKSPLHEAAPKRTDLAIPEIKPLRILVAGELILDRYLWGDVKRISPEAPIPILQVHRREEKPGNAGFVMANLRALGARPSALSVIGADRNGAVLREMFRDLGIGTRSLVADPDRPTIVKERMLGSVQSANRATQQLLRVDEEDPRPLSPVRERALKARIADELKRADGVLVSDINKGLLTPGLLRALIDGANRHGIPIVIDPRLSEDFSIYRGATALTPNRFETETATGMRLHDRADWRMAAEGLVKRLDLQACLITLDRDGMYLAERGGADTYIPTTPREVYDVTGAGDVVLTFFGLMATAGLTFSSAAAIANLAAGIEVGRIGTEIISREDIARALAPATSGYERKILSSDELVLALDRDRRAGRRIVFTNGCFDLMHAGHLQLLGFARTQGEVLVVGLNSDRSVRVIKGPDRPINHAGDRARMLAALEFVDYVVVFDENRAERVIRTVRPDILVKGEDYRGQVVDGQKFVESRGGQVALAPLLEGHSTSATVARLRSTGVIANATRSRREPKSVRPR
ncbi:MAG TPA: bifunctional heptose 7-phosphate kinase/heptose 1-phosphate adenyltransferase [Candidatus Binataceae bacterium]|jgi:D-beta-D-heptose 7-phosphate kinase/D-beta-D-heptose 1-phosphate adenosyltransferase|nr:bifunctional heptose 7-phosphate kinase/heptose 1-phosphate adenyltransferase [Candidatus Binataceae bacterium]